MGCLHNDCRRCVYGRPLRLFERVRDILLTPAHRDPALWTAAVCLYGENTEHITYYENETLPCSKYEEAAR